MPVDYDDLHVLDWVEHVQLKYAENRFVTGVGYNVKLKKCMVFLRTDPGHEDLLRELESDPRIHVVKSVKIVLDHH
jgi:hypothetical protein